MPCFDQVAHHTSSLYPLLALVHFDKRALPCGKEYLQNRYEQYHLLDYYYGGTVMMVNYYFAMQVTDPFHVVIAGHKAFQLFQQGKMKTRTLHSEIIFNFSPSTNVSAVDQTSTNGYLA